jgi:hypothetical protein
MHHPGEMMKKPSPPIVVISEYELNRLLDEGYNPLPQEFDREAFASEWNSVFDSIKAELEQYWQFGIGNGDFYMDSDWVPDRFLAVEVKSECMICDRLLNVIYRIVENTNADYAIDICDAWAFMKTIDGEPHPHFNIVVTKQRIMVYSESDEFLAKFGV